MEELTSSVPAPAPAPPPPPPPPPPPVAGASQNNLPSSSPAINQSSTKKRKAGVDTVHFQNSNYFKIRAVIKDLRPSFIEVLNAPDFRNCKAALEIRKQMQIMMELYKQLRMETVSFGKIKKPSEGPPLASESGEEPPERRQEEKQAKQPQVEKVMDKAPEEKVSGEKNPEKQMEGIQGTYIVGGSPIGWNFTMYPGSKAVYYGITKETWVSRQATKVSTPP